MSRNDRRNEQTNWSALQTMRPTSSTTLQHSTTDLNTIVGWNVCLVCFLRDNHLVVRYDVRLRHTSKTDEASTLFNTFQSLTLSNYPILTRPNRWPPLLAQTRNFSVVPRQQPCVSKLIFKLATTSLASARVPGIVFVNHYLRVISFEIARARRSWTSLARVDANISLFPRGKLHPHRTHNPV